MLYQEWALKLAPHKAGYFHTKKDQRRRDIVLGELCQINWIFHFKGHDEVRVAPRVLAAPFPLTSSRSTGPYSSILIVL